MDLIFEEGSGNSYTIKDGVIEADVELLGGGNGMLIVLHSIKALGLPKDGVNTDVQSLADYLAEEIIKQKRLGKFTIIHKGKVLFSLNKEVKSGTQIRTDNIRQISMGDYGRIMLRDTVAALRRFFTK